MKAIDIEGLLSETSSDPPCGPDLRYDTSYLELDRIFQGSTDEEEEPNWGEVQERCLDLLGRTKDLRVALYLALAFLKTEGVSGVRDGLGLLRGLLERFWDHVHPRLEPDDNDPLERLNIIESLCAPPGTFQDPIMFVQRLREAPLCNSPQLGQFSLRDILIAKGELTPADDSDASRPEMPAIEAAFEDTTTEELQEVAQATDDAIGHLEGIDAALALHVESGAVPDLTGSQRVLADIRKCVQGYLARRGVAPTTTEEQEGAGTPERESPGGGWSMGEIRSREDVLSALEKVCRYYEQHEPSSPVPLLLKRAKRLVAKSFVEIIRDLSPESTKQIEHIGGIGADAPTQ